jgi:ectoine hydroxylase-related dioxygenase (phytanoyl-CoA dioxygenase family)
LTTYQEMITDKQRQAYEREGWFVLEGVLGDTELADLRGECQRFIDKRDSEMDAAGTDHIDLCMRGRRYFVNNCSTESGVLRRFVLGERMADICRVTLGPDAYLFNDQYVVKGTEGETSFSWHQDSGYIPYPHSPYLTCWIALDEVDESNGTVYVLPYSRAGTRDVVPHRRDEATGDMIGYFGNDIGIPAVVPAGSIVGFSSTVFHRSGANTTPAMRRAYVVQYSPEPILSEDGSGPRIQSVPLLRDGDRVASDAS